jgi:hypothetical protein
MNKLYTTLLAGSLLVGVAAASNAAAISYNFFETDSVPTPFAYTYSGTGTTYDFSGFTTETDILFGSSIGSVVGNVPYSATLSVFFVTSEGSFPGDLTPIDTLVATFKANPGGPFPTNTNILTLTAGTTGTPGEGGTLNAPDGFTSGAFFGSNPPTPPINGQPIPTEPDNVVYTSALFSTAGFINQSYSFTLTLPPGSSFSYSTSGPPLFSSQLNPFPNSSITGGGVLTATTTPEPGSVALAVGALVSFGALRLRRRK